MPYPAQVTREALIERAHQMIETEGSAESVSLAALAAEFGIKAPSLYRHVANKTALLQGVNLITMQRLTAEMRSAVEQAAQNPQERVLAMGRAYRDFALANPVTYQLAFATPLDVQPDPAALEGLAEPLQVVMAEVSGEKESLMALRGAWALIHGFVMLELRGLFRREGDVEAAFFRALEAYIAGW